MNDIAEYLRDRGRGLNRPVICRTDGEREALVRLLESPEEAPRPAGRDGLNAAILGCGKCGKGGARRTGVGTASRRIMIILNQPRMVSEVERKLLRGDSAALLKKMLGAIDVEIGECYVTGVI